MLGNMLRASRDSCYDLPKTAYDVIDRRITKLECTDFTSAAYDKCIEA